MEIYLPIAEMSVHWLVILEIHFLLAVLMLTVCLGLLWGLVVKPADIYTMRMVQA